MPRCYQAPSAAPSDPAARLEVVTELGPLAQAGTVEDAAQQGDAVVLSIPLKAVKDLPDGLLRGKVVLDTSNYYPFRDGSIDVLVNNTVTTSELMQDQLPGARLVKAFNNIIAAHIPQLGGPNLTPPSTGASTSRIRQFPKTR